MLMKAIELRVFLRFSLKMFTPEIDRSTGAVEGLAEYISNIILR